LALTVFVAVFALSAQCCPGCAASQFYLRAVFCWPIMLNSTFCSSLSES
jgi:hypothetical protein